MEYAAERGGDGIGRKDWVACMERDVRAFGILGNWRISSLQEGEWYSIVIVEKQRFMDA